MNGFWNKNSRASKQPSRLACAALVCLLFACQPAPRTPVVTIELPKITAASPSAVPQDPTLTASPAPILSPTPRPSSTPEPVKPTPTTTAQQCREKHGKIITQSLHTSRAGGLTYTVYLPPCYSASVSHRYPVLYLLHGVNNNNLQWVHIGAAASADEMILDGEISPFLIVMPKEDDFNEAPDNSDFAAQLVNNLVPQIDGQYATCAERSCRAIGGLSRGSGWAFRIGLTSWQLFGAIGAHSFSPFSGDLDRLPGWLALSTAGQHPRIYIDIGTHDQAVPGAMAVAEKLSELRVPHEWHLFEGAHNEDYWKEHMKNYLRWYAEAWK